MITNFNNPNDKRQYSYRWPLVDGKRLFRVIDERSVEGTEELLSVSHITGITPRSQKNVTMFKSESLVGYKKCAVGDIAANTMWTWQGAIGVSQYEGVISPAYNVYRQRNDIYNPRYLDMLLREKHLVDVYHSISTGIRPSRLRLYPEPFLTIALPVPPREEQDQIVRYLDWQISKINKLIAAKKKQISLLREQRRGVVNNIVIGATTEKNEQSRVLIDGIGCIPSNWECRPLKHYAHSNTASLSGNTPSDYELDYIDISTVGFGYLKDEPVHYLFSEAPSRARRIIHQGDTIISTVRTYLRSMCYVDASISSCIVSTGFAVLTPNAMILPELLGHILCSDYFVNAVSRNSIGVSYPAINDSRLMSLKISVPRTQSEQQVLLNEITEQADLYQRLYDKMQCEIVTLHELRTRLISDVVTGQIDVRSIEVPDFEMVEEIDTDEAPGEDEASEEAEEQEE